VTVPVSLSSRPVTVQLFAGIDTGAEYCLFERAYAEELRIDLERGSPLNFSTVAGNFRAYGHELTLAVLGIQVHAVVYFYGNPNINRNVLGRNGWLNRIRLGLVDYDSTLYMSAYND
jgi:hypothetical protein